MSALFTNTGCEVDVVGSWDVLGAPVVVRTPAGAVVKCTVTATESDHVVVTDDDDDGTPPIRLYARAVDCPDVAIDVDLMMYEHAVRLKRHSAVFTVGAHELQQLVNDLTTAREYAARVGWLD